MKKIFLMLLNCCMLLAHAQNVAKTKNFVLVIHGGAGAISKQNLTQEKELAYKNALLQALQAGYEILNRGGSAVAAVEASLCILEDNPLFNAGKGAVFTSEGKNELDAAIMNGKTLEAGAVAGLTTVKNPVKAARAVMEKSPHVLLSGKGADQFAAQQGLEIVDPGYFSTEARWKSFQKIKLQDSLSKTSEDTNKLSVKQPENRDYKYGTVGAVALDMDGNLAAATSTGGMSNKKYGRIGDSPIIGAGTYANNKTCAISCTGWGEYFMRLVVAKTVSDLMEYKNYTVQQAAEEMILKEVPQLGGDGGLIAVDKKGNIAMPFNTTGMFRGYIKPGGKAVIKIFAP